MNDPDEFGPKYSRAIQLLVKLSQGLVYGGKTLLQVDSLDPLTSCGTRGLFRALVILAERTATRTIVNLITTCRARFHCSAGRFKIVLMGLTKTSRYLT
jgi:hypothetical protein